MLNQNTTSSNNLRFRMQLHPFQIMNDSVMPFLISWALGLFLFSTVLYLHGSTTICLLPISFVLHISFLSVFTILLAWLATVLKEGVEGFHTRRVQYALRFGFILFIVSEIMFFFAFFWAFFHVSLAPSIMIGSVWPPVGTQPVDAWGLPLVNTVILLSSGVTITIAHHALVDRKERFALQLFVWYLTLTILFGIVFLACQYYEYKHGLKFSWRNNIYGTTFFALTGFHGLHVTLGTVALMLCWLRQYIASVWATEVTNGEANLLKGFTFLNTFDIQRWGFRSNQHIGFEAAAWYWHFVDVVWLFLFISVYWWGN